MYADDPDNASTSLVYGNVAVMFLFQGFYSIAWTPLLYLYPPEVMNYSIRANGLAVSYFALNAFAYVLKVILHKLQSITDSVTIASFSSSSCRLV